MNSITTIDLSFGPFVISQFEIGLHYHGTCHFFLHLFHWGMKIFYCYIIKWYILFRGEGKEEIIKIFLPCFMTFNTCFDLSSVISFPISSRRIKKPSVKEVFVCFHASASQSMIELAFRLGFGAMSWHQWLYNILRRQYLWSYQEWQYLRSYQVLFA